MRILKTFEPDEVVLGMTTFREMVVVATTKAVYRIRGDDIQRLEVKRVEQETNTDARTCAGNE